MQFFRILMAALVLLASFHAAARAPVPIINYENVPVASGAGTPVTLAQVKQAIVSAAALKQWELTDQGPGRMVATLNVRNKHTVMALITYSEKQFSVKYNDSVNMGYASGGEGPGMIHPFYNRWVGDLKERIRSSIARI